MKRIAKILCMMLAVILSVTTVTYAAAPEGQALKDINVPVAYICESKGGEAVWEAKTGTAVFKLGGKTLEVKASANQLIFNGRTTALKYKTANAGGRTLLPLSVVNEALGLEISNDDYLKLIAGKFIELIKKDRIEEGSALLSRQFSKYLTPQLLSLIAQSIKAIPFDEKTVEINKTAVHQNLVIPAVVQQINLNFIIRFDYEGKIDEIGSAQPQQALYSSPSYDNPENYTELEVAIGRDEWKLPATLTVPKGKGPFPAVILVHGSGAGDRDETVGAVKPFRDLAVGLAAKKIAVLRYDKRTLEHGLKIQLSPLFTMKEEFEEDAFAAAEYLKNNDLIDASNIIVLGHSQGGYALPEIMDSDSSGIFKAGIILSGCSRPIYELMIEQNEYFINKGLATKEQVDFIKNQVNMIKDPAFDPARPPAGYTLGTPFYFNHMKNYDVIGAAKAIQKPVLVMQGDADFQVSVKTDFDGWKKAFENNKAAEFKLYPGLNHVYTDVNVSGTIEDYYIKANIPQTVIDDISGFVNKVSAK